MKKLGIMLLLCTGVLLSSSAILRADAVADKRAAQNKLLAIRAARVDAMRKLSERINGLFITSETKVKDFVAESDKVKTAMMGWLQGMKEEGPAKINEDGTAEVKMSVTMEEVVVNLEQISKTYSKNGKFRQSDFEQMTVTNKEKVLTETGMGAPRPELQDNADVVPIKEGTPIESMDYLTGAAKAYWLANVQPQGRLMAVRAARVDGMRRLGERIKGVFITSTTTVKDFVAQSDDIKTDMQAFLKGVREVDMRYHADEPIVEVDVEVTLQAIYASLEEWGEAHYKGDKVVLRKLEELKVQVVDKIIKETGQGVPPEKYLKDVKVVSTVAASAPGWINETMSAVGNGAVDADAKNPASAKLMAYRAAELDARRKLAEQLDGLMITSNTAVKDFVAMNDDIRTAMMTFQLGAHMVEGSQKMMEDGTAQVTVEIELRPLWNSVTFYQRKLSLTIK